MLLLNLKLDACKANHPKDKIMGHQAVKARERAIETQIAMVESTVTLTGWRTILSRRSNSTMRTLTTRELQGRNMRMSFTKIHALRSLMDSCTLAVILLQEIRKRFRNGESLMSLTVPPITQKIIIRRMESSTSHITCEITPRKTLLASSTMRYNSCRMLGARVEKFMSTACKVFQDLLQFALLI